MGVNIKTFIITFKAKKTDDEKKDLLLKHITSTYIPFEKKIAAANSIIDSCYWSGEGQNRYLHIDSTAKYMLTCMTLLKLYTDLEYKNDEILEIFNLLNENKIFDFMGECIDRRDFNELNMIIDLVGKDVITNEYENHAYITKQLDRFLNLISNMLPPFLERLDLDKLQEILDKSK